MQSTLKSILSHFFKRGKEQTRWRDVKTGRFAKRPNFYRFVWGCKGIPWHGTYVSFAYFTWDFEKPKDGEEKLLKYMEKWLGYDFEEWWFSFKIGFGEMTWPYDKTLEGKEEYEP